MAEPRKFLVPIELPGDPTEALQAATKAYVDAHAGGGGATVAYQPEEPAGPHDGGDLWLDSDDLSGPLPAYGNPVQSYSWVAPSNVNLTSTTPVTIADKTIPNPGAPVVVEFGADGYVYKSSGDSGVALLDLLISTDGGATFSTSSQYAGRGVVELLSGEQFRGFSVRGRWEGIPTGDIVIRSRGELYGSDVGPLIVQAANTEYTARVITSGAVHLDNRYQRVSDDTGWTTLTKDAGWGAGDVRIRRSGKVVVLDFSVTIGSTASGARLTNIPSDLRASIPLNAAGVSNSGGGVPVQCLIESDGDVMIYYPSGPGSSNAVRANVTWMID